MSTSYSKERKIVAEAEAILVARTVMPLLGTEEIVRCWPRVIDNETRAAAKYLEDYTSANNTQPQFSVTDPLTGEGKTTHSGTWRGVSVRMAESGEQEGIYQVLRLGFAATLGDAVSRLQVVDGTPESGSLVLTQYWHCIDPSYVAPLVNGIIGTKTVTNPHHHLSGTLTGTFAASGLHGELAADGSGVITRTLTQVNNLSAGATAALDDLAALSYRTTLEEQVLELFGLQANGTVAKEGTAWNMALVFPNINPSDANRQMCMDTLTRAELEAKFKNIPQADDSDFAWIFADRKWQVQADGTAQFIILFQKVTWDNTWADKYERKRSNVGSTATDPAYYAAQLLYEADHIPASGAVAAYLAARTEAIAADDHAAVTSVALRGKGNGEYAVSQTREKFYTGTAGTDAIVLGIKPGMGGAQTPTLLRIWYRRTQAAMTTLTGAAGAARMPADFESHTYSHADCDITPHGDGAYTVRQVLIYTADGEVYWSAKRITRQTFHRSGNELVMQIQYRQHTAMKSSAAACQTWFNGLHRIREGSIGVTQRGRFLFEAHATTVDGSTGWKSSYAVAAATAIAENTKDWGIP